MEIERVDDYLFPISCPEFNGTANKAPEALGVTRLKFEIDLNS